MLKAISNWLASIEHYCQEVVKDIENVDGDVNAPDSLTADELEDLNQLNEWDNW